LRVKDSELLGVRLESANQKIEKSQLSQQIEHRDLAWSQEREEEVIRIAEETIESLRRQMSRKDEMIEKYRSMVKELRQDILLQKEVDLDPLHLKN
jgi:xylose isomerase